MSLQIQCSARKKDEFLLRGSNKQALINIISSRLRGKACNCKVFAASEYGSTTLIGEDTDLLVPFLKYIYAFTKFDTTSTIFGVGNRLLFQKFAKGDKDIKSCALCFTNPSETCDAIEQNGYKAMVLLSNGKPTDNLASLKHVY